MTKPFSVLCAGLLMLFATHAAIGSGAPEPGKMPVILHPNVRPGERVVPARPSGPARQIDLREIKIDDALLKRLADHPVALPGRLSAGDRDRLNAVTSQIKQGNSGSARDLWGQAVASYSGRGGANGTDINAMIQWVLRESYLGQMEDLKDYAEKVKYYNNIKKTLREHLAETRKTAIRMASPESKKIVEVVAVVRFPPRYRPGATATFKRGRIGMNRDDLKAYVKNLEEQLGTVGNDAQLAQMQLQDALQKRQQVIQAMSNIMKMMNDTAKSIIQNMK
jgi:hypothetical protein